MSAEQINQLFSFLYAGTLGDLTFWLRLVLGVITSALIGAIFVIALKIRELHLPLRPIMAAEPSAPSPRVAQEPWQEVGARIESVNPADWHVAVIRADAIFDAVLKDMGLIGQTMGDRLRQLDLAKLHSLNDVWGAHKIRNRIAHETDRVLSHDEARQAVAWFEKGLHELHYLDEG